MSDQEDRIKALVQEAAALQEIIERIMTQHWDMRRCTCWVCAEGRKLGCCPREGYLHDKTKGEVDVHEVEGA